MLCPLNKVNILLILSMLQSFVKAAEEDADADAEEEYVKPTEVDESIYWEK